ncbi:alcohol dehydrogenase [Brenneria alni]|uniref:Alcohol dehydrogenase n=1 Tax=Brenneria alni TaxID=71656 RepID=A0A421DQX0_9GAMM|nr:aldo/keto reductase [Brenneria alni]RLM26401.1 alcohol dehydrogenase [Brenneria alni]
MPGTGKRQLGRSGIEIAPFVLGGNVFGWGITDKQRAFDILDHYLDAGFQAIDTADAYSHWVPGNSGGDSETLIGEWLRSRGRRDSVVLITKVGAPWGDNGGGLAPAYIERAVEGSLRRLQTDHIDVYFSHFPDPATPHEETLAAYQRLIEAGKVRAIGASNFSIEQVRVALDVSAANGLPRYEVLQPTYNLYDRRDDGTSGYAYAYFDRALADLALADGLGVITHSSLAQGFLSGKYRSEADLSQSVRGPAVARYLNAHGHRILAALDEVAARHQAQPAEVALAWNLSHRGLTAPIASVTSIEQLDSLLRAPALAQALTEEDIAVLNQADTA